MEVPKRQRMIKHLMESEYVVMRREIEIESMNAMRGEVAY